MTEITGLNITDEKLHGFSESMEAESSGVFHISDSLSPSMLESIQGEINNPEQVAWRDGSDDFVNARGVRVKQVFEAYALKLHVGDKSTLEKVNAVVTFASAVQSLVRSTLSLDYPALSSWKADEAVLQRYPNRIGGLTYHKDNARHTGLIVIASIEGEAVLTVKHKEAEQTIATSAGSLILLRASGLLPGEPDLRPEHAVSDITTPTRTSLTVRSNNKPFDAIEGFTYDNWSA